VAAILDAGDSNEQALAFQCALKDPRISALAQTAFIFNPADSEEAFVAMHCLSQAKTMIGMARATTNKNGRIDDDRRAYAECVGSALVSTPDIDRDGVPTNQQVMRLLNIKRSLFSSSQEKRKKLKRGGEEEAGGVVEWSQVRRRKRWSKVDQVLLSKVQQWVRDHSMVQECPNVNDTLLVKDPITGLKTRVRKLLLYIPVRELHNDLLGKGGLPEARDSNQNVLISDTRLRTILPTELRAATDSHKQMCGCQYCLTTRFLQAALNAFRRVHVDLLLRASSVHGLSEAMVQQKKQRHQQYRDQVFPGENNMPLHPKPRDALLDVMCPWVDNDLPNWNCACGICADCPEYQTPDEEKGTGSDAPKVNFQLYVRVTRCTFHGVLTVNAKSCPSCDAFPQDSKKGQVRTRKLLGKFTRPIGTFLTDYYIPAIDEYKYHLPHVIILSKLHCGTMRQTQFESIPYALKTIRDYAERVKPELNFEAQLDKFGNPRDLSLEGSSVCSYNGESLKQYSKGEILKEDLEFKKVFMSHLSDKSEQDAGTTYNNMYVEYEKLRLLGELMKYMTIDFNNTDGCTAQYRCYKALYLLSMLSFRLAIIIDRAVGAPGHGKDEVDGLNAVDKRYLQTKMRVVATAGENDDNERMMRAHAMVENENFSMAGECYRLLSNPERVDGVGSFTKHVKRESEKKVQSRMYFLQKHEDVEHDNLKCTGKLESGPGKRNGLRNIRADPDLDSSHKLHGRCNFYRQFSM
jgi:hypothetical protein